MKKFLKILLASLAFLIILYFIGPKPDAPNFLTPKIDLPDSLADLEDQIVKEERLVKGLKPDNEARIVWNDSTRKQKTKIALLFLNGFTSSPMAGAPTHTELAKKFDANVYLFRNAHHGIDLGDSTMIDAKADDFIYAAEKALAIAKKLGDEVVIVGTSLGGALAIYLASKYPEIKAIVLYSPGIRFVDEKAKLIIGHWGFQLAKTMTGSVYVDYKELNALQIKYLSTHIHFNGTIACVNFIINAMNKETFQKVKCPVFLGYWYENEQIQDDVISVKSMLEMYDALGTPLNLKRKKAFTTVKSHDIGTPMNSKDYKSVMLETKKFLEEVVLK